MKKIDGIYLGVLEKSSWLYGSAAMWWANGALDGYDNNLLNTFAESTGLRVNYSKSFMVPINVSDEKMQYLANTFSFQVGSLPFTYLRVPLGIHKPSVADCLPLVQCVERRVVACSLFVTQGGKLQMVKSILSSLPTFYMCTIKLHKLS